MRVICAVLLAVGALVAAGCGGGGDAGTAQAHQEGLGPVRKISVTLDGYGGPENVGLLMAQQRGYFADARLSVSMFSPVLPARPVSYVVTREDDLGLVQEPQLVLSKVKGAPVIAVGSLVRRPSASMISLKRSHIGDLSDLKGKTVAIPGLPFQKALLESLLTRHGVNPGDVKVKSVGYELVPALLSGSADAIFGGSWNLEAIELKSRGAAPEITRFKSLRVPAYDELEVVARPDFVAKESAAIRDFMSAVARGTAAAIEDPGAAVKAIEESNLERPGLGRKTLEAEVAATLPLLSKSGYIYPQQSMHLVDWMHRRGIIDQFPTPPELLIDDYAAWQP